MKLAEKAWLSSDTFVGLLEQIEEWQTKIADESYPYDELYVRIRKKITDSQFRAVIKVNEECQREVA